MHRLAGEELLDDGVDVWGVVGEGADDAVLDVAESCLGLDRDLGVRSLPVGAPVVDAISGGRRRNATWASASRRWPSGVSGGSRGRRSSTCQPASRTAYGPRTATTSSAEPSVHTETTLVTGASKACSRRTVSGMSSSSRLTCSRVAPTPRNAARRSSPRSACRSASHRARTSFTLRTLGGRAAPVPRPPRGDEHCACPHHHRDRPAGAEPAPLLGPVVGHEAEVSRHQRRAGAEQAPGFGPQCRHSEEGDQRERKGRWTA